MIHGFDVYRMYLALKQHFTNPNYDYFQYDGKTSAKETTYQQRNDFWFFETLAKKHTKEEVQNFLLASFIYAKDPKALWIGDIKRDGANRYMVRQKQMERLAYSFMSDCDTVDDYLERQGDDFNSLFETEHAGYHGPPTLLKLFLKEKISLETLLIFDVVLGFMKRWDNDLHDPLWESLSLKIKKYKPFLSINKNKYKEILRSKFCG